VVLAFGDHLGAQGGVGTLPEVGVVILLYVYLHLNLIQSVASDVASLFKSVGNLEWMDSLVEHLLSLLKDGSGQDHHTGGSVANFVVLGGGQLDQQLRGLMMDLEQCKIFNGDLPPSSREWSLHRW